LTTDFGLHDTYVGTMKGVILGLNPQASIVDLTHEVPPQNLREAAFAVYTAYRYFTKETVHVVVVDPGVGSTRRAVVLLTPRGIFVGPDNGVFSLVIGEEARLTGTPISEDGGLIKLPPIMTAIDLQNKEYWLPAISTTFHGRDVFAPVAAQLSMGLDPHRLGETIDSLNTFRARRPHVNNRGVMVGAIIHTDRFGNMVTNITKQHLADFGDEDVIITVGDRQIKGLSTAYVGVEPGQVLALIGGSDHLEIAARNGSAQRLLGLSAGDKIFVLPAG
jgi:S-adenosyl-L-methionine hydrolase (adenosine-forming)